MHLSGVGEKTARDLCRSCSRGTSRHWCRFDDLSAVVSCGWDSHFGWRALQAISCDHFDDNAYDGHGQGLFPRRSQPTGNLRRLAIRSVS